MKKLIQRFVFIQFSLFSIGAIAQEKFCETGGAFTDTADGCKHRGLIWSAPEDKSLRVADAAAYCAALPIPVGFEQGWRLPTDNEFGTLTRGGAVTVLKKFTPDQLYWNSTIRDNYPLAYFMPNEISIAVEDSNVELSFMCVLRTTKDPVCQSAPNFKPLNHGCLVSENLLWSRTAVEQIPLAEAQNYCLNLDQKNDFYKGWRLPFQHELMDLAKLSPGPVMTDDMDYFFWAAESTQSKLAAVQLNTGRSLAEHGPLKKFGAICVADQSKPTFPRTWEDKTLDQDGKPSSCRKNPSRCVKFDSETELNWTGVQGVRNFDAAKSLCNRLHEESYNEMEGWRLPSVLELTGIAGQKFRHFKSELSPSPDEDDLTDWMWARTGTGNFSGYWTVNMETGSSVLDVTKSQTICVSSDE
ncbi:MAG: hypothetical protein NTV34_10935 [Proteobacteria bacterium]|nr:hypothetical protein [Pseudomonadota bacterium]